MDQSLTAAITDTLGRPFVWGESDCVLWATDVVRSMSGADLLGNEWRGRWANEADAVALLPRGLGPVAARRLRELGWTQCHVEKADEGDVALVRAIDPRDPSRRIHALAVIARPGWAVARGDGGVRFCPATEIARVWKCPR